MNTRSKMGGDEVTQGRAPPEAVGRAAGKELGMGAAPQPFGGAWVSRSPRGSRGSHHRSGSDSDRPRRHEPASQVLSELTASPCPAFPHHHPPLVFSGSGAGLVSPSAARGAEVI